MNRETPPDRQPVTFNLRSKSRAIVLFNLDDGRMIVQESQGRTDENLRAAIKAALEGH